MDAQFSPQLRDKKEDRRGGDARAEAIDIRPRPLHLDDRILERLRCAGMIGESPKFLELLREVLRVAHLPVDATTLYGETGTGKTTVARAIHTLSARSSGPFVHLNCASVPSELIESELFGHERGAFTDAKTRKMGKFEEASGGTLFLDEIAEMPPRMQAKILTALEEKKFYRVGGNEEVRCDLRLILATNGNLKEMVARREFRQDLYSRLGLIQIRLPSLAERREDIPLIFSHYLRYFQRKFGRAEDYTIEAGVERMLMLLSWPENVRQLRAAAELLALVAFESGVIKTDDVEKTICSENKGEGLHSGKAILEVRPNAIPMPPYREGEETFMDYSLRALEGLYSVLLDRTGNHQRAASLLGINPRSLYDRLKKARSGTH